MFKRKKNSNSSSALSGRTMPHQVKNEHFVNGNAIEPPFPGKMQFAMFGLGCFWGAEKIFWEINGIHSTHVGYTGGNIANPSYQQVCTGKTGHSEVVRIVFNPDVLSYTDLLKIFWESHNPTQGMRQGNDVGSQYRSGIYTYSDQQYQQATESLRYYQQKLAAADHAVITTEIKPTSVFFYAEDYHQQYLAKNPDGYCGLGGTGVCYG